MTVSGPNADTNLVKPARGTVPSPLRVSTMHELEYGTVVLRFGRDLPSGTSKVYCKGITLTVPTGVSGADLTREPSLITTAVSIVEGEAQGTEWWVDRDTTDPNKAVFSFVPDTTAVFDGTWAVSLTLSGIEVNPSIGTVDLKVEETTSTTGAEDSYQKRNGEVEVKKGNDEFFFRSLHPRSVVINRGSTVDLLWEAPADNRITYTMYYRKADGTETSDSVQANFANRVWKSPVLDDNANFTLKATLDGQDYFLTTSLTVNNPNVVVNTLNANSNVTVAAAGTLTTHGPVQANNDVTIKSDKALKVTLVDPVVANGTVTVRGNLTVSADKKLTAGPLSAGAVTTGAVTAGGLVTANGGLTVKSDKTLSAGEVTIANGKVLSVSKIKSPVNSAIELQNSINQTAGGITTGSLTVNVNGTLTVNGTLAAKGATDLLGAPQSWSLTWNSSKTFTAPTSGLAIALVHSDGGNRNPMVTITSEGRTTRASALKFNSPPRDGRETTMLGIRKGKSCTVWFGDSGGDSGSDYKSAWLIWIPFGAGSISL
ncbi:hypothetical protein [Kitasatospora sp. NBC_01302]|uniref:hypothetical protein n=1 Tax=Kitasatospora sp. NBC_01302 TaxID=2903575 RepID=UPI002E12C187|nr:hypothetical protein OG294_04880 [Kitasatospora sp. NBC_01302]